MVEQALETLPEACNPRLESQSLLPPIAIWHWYSNIIIKKRTQACFFQAPSCYLRLQTVSKFRILYSFPSRSPNWALPGFLGGTRQLKILQGSWVSRIARLSKFRTVKSQHPSTDYAVQIELSDLLNRFQSMRETLSSHLGCFRLFDHQIQLPKSFMLATTLS